MLKYRKQFTWIRWQKNFSSNDFDIFTDNMEFWSNFHRTLKIFLKCELEKLNKFFVFWNSLFIFYFASYNFSSRKGAIHKTRCLQELVLSGSSEKETCVEQRKKQETERMKKRERIVRHEATKGGEHFRSSVCITCESHRTRGLEVLFRPLPFLVLHFFLSVFLSLSLSLLPLSPSETPLHPVPLEEEPCPFSLTPVTWSFRHRKKIRARKSRLGPTQHESVRGWTTSTYVCWIRPWTIDGRHAFDYWIGQDIFVLSNVRPIFFFHSIRPTQWDVGQCVNFFFKQLSDPCTILLKRHNVEIFWWTTKYFYNKFQLL